MGRHMVERLLVSGYRVKVFDINRNDETNDSVTYYTGDICNKQDLLPSLQDSDIVFHHASPPAAANDESLFNKVNVLGTQSLIEACIESGVKRLVLTSSASVVYNGSDIKNGTEDLPYADPPMDYYTQTKIIQEKLVLDANNTDESRGPVLMTVAIRPHGIFGPHDRQNIPVVLNAAKNGKMKFIIGDGKNIVDFTYVENVTHGHLLAAEALHEDSIVCGQAYNITNDEPLPFSDYISQLVVGFGYPPPSIHLPFNLILILAMLLGWLSWLLSPLVTIRPLFTPMRVRIAGTYHYYNCQKAKDHFNYKPIFTFTEGMEKSIQHFKNNN